MYLSHFGLQEPPFTLTPNTQFYFGLPSHNEAMEVPVSYTHLTLPTNREV